MTRLSIHKVVIVGGGQAGGEAALHLRQGGFKGDITVVCEEPIGPYQRPPLSKKYLSGEVEKALVRSI
jgi:3-phenylpropionate/trans-cinnamate dioxygenase ferredoxin reductase component